MVIKTIVEESITEGGMGDSPFKIGNETIAPETWQREEILSMRPLTKREKDTTIKNKARFMVQTPTGEYMMKSLSDAPDYLLFVNDKPIITISRNYQPVTHYDCFRVVKQVMDEQNITPKRTEIRTWNDGCAAKLVVITDEVSFNGDVHDIGFMVSNSFDKTSQISAATYIYRQICTNGMHAWAPRTSSTRRHSNKADNMLKFRPVLEDLISRSIDNRSFLSDEMKKLADTFVNAEWVRKASIDLQFRKWELEETNSFNFEYPLDTDEGHITPLKTPYSKWDFVIDATSIGTMNRSGTGDRKPNMARADFIERTVLDCVRR